MCGKLESIVVKLGTNFFSDGCFNPKSAVNCTRYQYNTQKLLKLYEKYFENRFLSMDRIYHSKSIREQLSLRITTKFYTLNYKLRPIYMYIKSCHRLNKISLKDKHVED